MKTSSVLLLAGALVLAATSALVARALMRPPPPEIVVKEVQVEPPASRQILVAVDDLEPGEFIKGNSFSPKPVPVGEIRAGDVEASYASNLNGATLRQPLKQDEPLRFDLLVRPNEPGFLAAVLGKGMRAITVPTNPVASNAGQVAADDRVDVILSLDVNGIVSAPGANQPPPLAAETILCNVRVLALGVNADSIVPVHTSSEPENKADAQKRATANQYSETVTLEVNPQQAEQLAVAKGLGTLHMSLRRADDQTCSQTSENSRRIASSAGDVDGVTRLSDTTNIFGRVSVRNIPSATVYMGRAARQTSLGNSR